MNEYSKAYLKNYNNFVDENTDDLLEIYLYGNNSFLRQIAKDVIIHEHKLDEYCDNSLLEDFISKINITELWQLSGSKRSLVRHLVKNEIRVISKKNLNRNQQCTLQLVK